MGLCLLQRHPNIEQLSANQLSLYKYSEKLLVPTASFREVFFPIAFSHDRQRFIGELFQRLTTYVFRFSQPLDVFFRPYICRSYFIPDPLTGFALQSFAPLT